jgi:hypothetical protein
MYCLIILPLLLQYMTNAKYLISSCSVMLKATLIIPKMSSIYGLNLERSILDKILYEVDSSDIP